MSELDRHIELHLKALNQMLTSPSRRERAFARRQLALTRVAAKYGLEMDFKEAIDAAEGPYVRDGIKLFKKLKGAHQSEDLNPHESNQRTTS